MDILEFQGHNYLVVVDFFSHFPKLRLIKGKTAKDVMGALRSIFVVHDVPVEVIADNMPFGSEAMRHFSPEWSFKITTSSPHYHQSNGMAERYVQTIKQILKKAVDSNSNIYQSLLAYRQTPVAGLPFSPAEMLFSRCVRGPLPYTEQMLKPQVPAALPLLQQRQSHQKEMYDMGAKELEPLVGGDKVLVRAGDQQVWNEATLLARSSQPRSYIVDSEGSQLLKNRTQLKSVPSSSNPVLDAAL